MNDEQKNKLLQHATNLVLKKQENKGVVYDLKDAKDEVINNLFSKEIEVQNVLVDTANLDDHTELFDE